MMKNKPMDPKNDNPDASKATSVQKPQGWSDSVSTSWQKAKSATLESWNKVTQTSQKLEHRFAEEALAFGHGAQEAYAKVKVWSGEFEDKLKADWTRVQSRAGQTWDSVREAVKYGWEKAKEAAADPKNKGI